jgi:hypothetical protein
MCIARIYLISNGRQKLVHSIPDIPVTHGLDILLVPQLLSIMPFTTTDQRRRFDLAVLEFSDSICIVHVWVWFVDASVSSG